MKSTTYQLHSNGKYWTAQWIDSRGHRRRKSLGAKRNLSQRQAQASIQTLIAEHAKTPLLSDLNEHSTIESWVSRYLDIRAIELDAATIKIHARTGDLLLEYFNPSLRLDHLTVAGAEDWRLWLSTEKRLAEATVCKHVRTVKVLFNKAVTARLIAENPFSTLKGTAPIKQVFDRRIVPEGDVLAFMEASPRLGTLIALGYYAGLRLSEARNLRWSEINWSERKLTVVPRSGMVTTKQRLREVRIEKDLMDILLEKQVHTDSEFACGLPIEITASSQNIEKVCRRIGIARFTMQTLRQTRDTLWHQEFPSYIVCAWLGHSEQVARRNYLSIPDEAYAHSEPTSNRPQSSEEDAGGDIEWAYEDYRTGPDSTPPQDLGGAK